MVHCSSALLARWGLALVAVLVASPCLAASDLYVRDTVSDSGAEPYAGPGPVYLSPDIWVLPAPDPNFDPRPFPTGTPPWTLPPHENPEYRNGKTSLPNYVYVQVHNRGDLASSGTEWLRLYQAKASTGLAWPANWVDSKGTVCGDQRLLGMEITKPRRNAKSVDVSSAERDAYRDAVVAIASDPAYRYSDTVQYFRKQNSVHLMPNPEHGNPAFLPWHREMMNRYEILLREVDPLVTLLYWDFTQSPTSGTNLFTTSFMGASSGTVDAPLVPLRPPTLTRNVGGSFPGVCGAALFQSDATFNGMGTYPGVSLAIEGTPNHDCAHGFIGGYSGGAGQISSLSTAAQDPFFFMLHANVDRQWANWQREGADPGRLDPVSIYGSDSSNARINATMSPWNGSSGLAPWNGAGAATNKTSKDRSVVFPPIYDTAPLRIPVLQPGQSVVIEIPWYPPNVNDYNCAGDAGHFCLLARIETSTTSPFGMTTLEGVSVGTNTRNNNNIAWKNVTIVDEVADPPLLRMISGTTIRNIFDREVVFEIALHDRTEKRRFLLPELARVSIALPDEILRRVRSREADLRDLKLAEAPARNRSVLEVAGKEPRFTLPMKPHETFVLELAVDLGREELPRELLVEPFHFDVEQRFFLPAEYFTTPCERQALEVGGVRFTLDFNRLRSRERLARVTGPGELRLHLVAPGRKLRAVQREAPAQVQHFSVGEPVEVIVQQEGAPDVRLRSLTLEVDGRVVARAGSGAAELRDEVRFDKPGVFNILTRAVDENGETVERRVRVLVSENIPPNAWILQPETHVHVRLGDTVRVVVEASPAFQREVAEVTLYAREGDRFETGLNLVRSPYAKRVASAEGPGPHEFAFTPDLPGMYMLQVGAVDDEGNVGVSGHVMVMVTQ
ncbi:MAG TPA: tyrosinase family protein [Thermoanaerobaculia bacterium]|nr:tyrosinase family protein [Thermoanaerobaculia bacterium]